MDTKTRPNYAEHDAGCWFDNHRGIYMGDAVIETAIEHGWKCDVEADETSWADCEEYHDLWTEAEDFMQQFAAEGFWFGSNESGDWGLWPNEEEE